VAVVGGQRLLDALNLVGGPVVGHVHGGIVDLTNSARKGPAVTNCPERRPASVAESGRVRPKLCQHKQPVDERPTTLATVGRFVCSITRGRTVLEELLEKDAVTELDNYRD